MDMINKIYKMFIFSLAVQICFLTSPVAQAQRSVPPAAFKDPERKQKLAAAFPEIEKLCKASAERMPGAVMGVIVDGELVWVKAAGVRETDKNAVVTPETVFRIASMTKSFTAMAILKLRDEG